MSAIAYTSDLAKDILKSYNDYLHLSTTDKKFVFIVEQDLTDPRMFTIVKDGLYEGGKLEGVKLIFNDPEDFKTKFPEMFAPAPVYIPTNTKLNARTGKIEGIKKDPIEIESVVQVEPTQYLVTLSEFSDVGCIWLYSLSSDSITISFYTSNDGEKFEAIKHLKGSTATIRDSDGKPISKFIPFNVDPNSENPTQTISTKYILLVINNTDLVYTPDIKVRVTRAFGI